MTFEKELFEFINTKYPDIPANIKETKELSQETEDELVKAIKEFKQNFNGDA